MRALCLSLFCASALFGAAAALPVVAQSGPEKFGEIAVTPAGAKVRRTLAQQLADSSNVLNFGADPSGNRNSDNSAAFNAANAALQYGVARKLVVPCGVYHVKHAVTFGNSRFAQKLAGDGRCAVIDVDSDFDPAAAGVLILRGQEGAAPQVEGMLFNFHQPPTQSSRTAFRTLAQGCTTGNGGSGCKYPPAIFAARANANRVRLRDISCVGAWDCISMPDGAAGGAWIEDIEVGALDIGIGADNAKDFAHIKGVHFWNFGFPYGRPIYRVFRDGTTLAARIGEIDGVSIVDFTAFVGSFAIVNKWSWGTISNLQLDGGRLDIAPTSAPAPVAITGFYTSFSGVSGCQVNVSGGRVSMSNVVIATRVPTFCISGNNGATLQVNGGRVAQNVSDRPIAELAGSGTTLALRGLLLSNNTEKSTVPIIEDRSDANSALIVIGNEFNKAGAGGAAVSIATDGPSKFVAANDFNGWTFRPPGPLGLYGLACSGSPSGSFASKNGVVTHC